MTQEEVTSAFLEQLDEMFGGKSLRSLARGGNGEDDDSERNPLRPASQSFAGSFIQDWGKEPFIKGGYSHPSVGTNKLIRQTLNDPLDAKVFFAGEATHPVAYMTLHGAMETGDMAANRLLKLFTEEPSPLPRSRL